MAAKTAPRQPLKKSVQALRAMTDKLKKAMEKDSEAGKPRDEQREAFAAALADATDMMNDYLHTGAPASYWLKGQQKGLFENIT
jgi:hypothetical protein